jgi:hypothetical protein
VVGHDAKLKSELTRAAVGGDADAWAELEVRNWARLVKSGKVDEAVVLKGRELAAVHGEEIVITRNAIRAGLRS